MKKKSRNALVSITAGVLLVSSIFLYQKWAIAKEIDPQKVVYVKNDIPPRTQITKEMVYETEISSKSIPPNALRNVNEVLGKWTNEGYGLSANSMVYKGKVVSTNELPDAGVLDLKKNEQSFPLLVDIEQSLGNSILPGSNVDLYFKTTVKEVKDGIPLERPIFGKLASNIRVTAAKDAQASNVFEGDKSNSENEETTQRQLTKLYIFAVTAEQSELLNKGKMLGEIVPIATGSSYTNSEGNAEFTKEDKLTQWIQAQTFDLKSGKQVQEDKQ